MKPICKLPPDEEARVREQLRAGTDPKRIGGKQSSRDKERPIYLPPNACAERVGDTIRLVLPWPPSANSYWRTAARGNRAITYLSKQAKAYRAVVNKIGERCRPLVGPVKVTATAYRPIRRGDLDNAAKVSLDCLQGIAFNSDAQIVESHWYLRDDKHEPRLEIEVVSLEKIQRKFA